MRAGAWMALLLVAAGLAGCIGSPDEADPTTAGTTPVPTGHPYPDGDEGWPGGLEGPFEPGEVLRDPLEGHDGTRLETTIYVPDLPDGLKAPVILWSTAALGGCWYGSALNAGTTTGCYPASHEQAVYHGTWSGVRPDVLVENGYAVAIVNVRGTGHSQGCYQVEGHDEQMDQAALVDHLADQPWSNGHVAAIGQNSWMAGIHSSEALKTVIALEARPDRYLGFHSVQGAAWQGTAVNSPGRAFLGIGPGPGGEADPDDVAAMALLAERACPDVVDALTVPQQGMYTDDRHPAFWEERRLITHLPDVQSAVLVKHSLAVYDSEEPRHGSFQEDVVWQVLDDQIPRRMILGATPESLPAAGQIEGAPFATDWYGDVVIPWLDFWLKGQGSPDRLGLGTVDYQAMDGTRHASDAWPPAEAKNEVLYLRPDGSLGPSVDNGQRSFRAVTDDRDMLTHPAVGETCPAANFEDPAMLLYLTEPLTEAVTIAGNPWLQLALESSEPGGTFTVNLMAGPGDAACRFQMPRISAGAVDLRFHEGTHTGADFPVDQITPVRTDLFNQAVTVEAGQRLGIQLWAHGQQSNPTWTPELTIHGGTGPEASHIVLPLIEGTLGGDASTLEYPPRPFLPEGVG